MRVDRKKKEEKGKKLGKRRHEKAFKKKGKREIKEDVLPVYGMLMESMRKYRATKEETAACHASESTKSLIL